MKERRDVARNRSRILTAAREVFRDQGLSASNDAVLAAAEVGVSTFYRHFRTRHELLSAVLAELTSEASAVAATARDIDDPWLAFCELFRRGCVLGEGDLALFYALADLSPELAAQAAELTMTIVGPGVERAKAAGVLAPSIGADDIVDLMTAAHSAPTPQRRATRTEVILEGLRRGDESTSRT
ncbi:TetR/AcrR family transcriptional regulator [Nocardia cyriacigeorgica]|uniref:TetR/AcrR family transcriptional regulator n=1 Tax=Nocardia cyriacigeorgica TaxID=135487 RepID=UPI001895486A|nr:TetR/AcrR family transcriptional regulator [Nocardia cyriacigeorgica]MBF6428504.1 TetR/AcrR family transcriptional regulator [Nocardia cyriacigeorgica]